MRFGLIAIRKFDGSLGVREWFSLGNPHPASEPGKPATYHCGLVDDDIRHQWPKEYAAFQAKLAEKKEALFEEARSAYPEVLFIPNEDLTPAGPEKEGENK